MTAPTELTAGTYFQSPREEEGMVRVVCDYGKCGHDNRPESVHVLGGPYGKYRAWSDFFIALPANYPIEEWGARIADAIR